MSRSCFSPYLDSAHEFLDRSKGALSDLHGKRVSIAIAKCITTEDVIKIKVISEIVIEGPVDPLDLALTEWSSEHKGTAVGHLS